MTDIFSSLIVPVTTNGPSLATLQWSEDGQAFVVTRSAIYILTPNTGINIEPSAAITASVSKPTNNVDVQPLSWYRTMVELEKVPGHHWALESQEWGTISIGSLDMSWSSITLSPTNLSKESCCVMVALNTNLEVSLWAPGKNYLTGQWSKVQDTTQIIKDTETIISSVVRKTLNAQVVSVSWSCQIPSSEAVHFIDGSLLALGNRAGRVIFMRLSKTDAKLQHVSTIDVADDWVQHLTWSSWKKTASDHFQASLACGIADGGIVIVSVSLFLERLSQEAMLMPRFEFKVHDEEEPCCLSDGSAITALTWVDSERHTPILVYAKPGIVHLRTLGSQFPLHWTGSHVLTLQLQPVSASSTPFAAVSGFVHSEQHDSLLVSLFDGSFNMIHGLSTSPTMDAVDDGFSSEDLTRRVRNIFAIVEGKVKFSDANRTYGMLDYDGAGSIGWLHENTRPDDFSYKQDAKHISMFIVARLWMDESRLFEQLARQLTRDTNFDAAPLHSLRGVFLHLRDATFLEAHQNRIVEFLRPIASHQTEPASPIPNSTDLDGGSTVSSPRLDFHRHLVTNLFRRRDIHSLRLKLAIANFCSSTQGNLSSSFGSLASEFASEILRIQQQTVIRQIALVVSQLDDNDRGFIHRWVTQSTAQNSVPLRQEAIALAHRVGVSADSPLESPDFQEQCPACHAVIPLGNSAAAICPNGHTWARCSITSFILATPFVRTCVGCCRKALLPHSQRDSSSNNGLGWFPPAASSWLVQELLESVSWCIFCGNRFVRVF